MNSVESYAQEIEFYRYTATTVFIPVDFHFDLENYFGFDNDDEGYYSIMDEWVDEKYGLAKLALNFLGEFVYRFNGQTISYEYKGFTILPDGDRLYVANPNFGWFADYNPNRVEIEYAIEVAMHFIDCWYSVQPHPQQLDLQLVGR